MTDFKNVTLPDTFQDEFFSILKSAFGDNLIFAFVFGSFAKKKGTKSSDIDTFICLQKRDPIGEAEYISWSQNLHNRLGLKFDHHYPAEVATKKQLETMLLELPTLKVSTQTNSEQTYDYVVWSQVLSDRKAYLYGDNNTIDSLCKACALYPEVWKEQILQQIHHSHTTENKSALEIIRYYAKFTPK